MAQIPYTPYSTVAPDPGSGEKVTTSPPPAAFGVNVAQAVEGLGGQLEKSGDELFTRAMALQDLRNETDAREAQTQYAEKASLLHAEYGAKEGKDAADGLEGYIKAQADLRTQFRDTLKTQYAQRYYDRDTLPFMQRNIFSAAGHAADQNKASIVGTAQAQLDLDTRTWVDPKNPAEFDDKVRKADRDIGTISDTEGYTPARQADAAAKQVANLRLGQIKEISLTDPGAAMDMLNDPNTKKQLGQVNFDNAFKTVQAQLHQTGSRVISDSVNKDLYDAPDPTRPEKGLQARVQEGMDIARKQHPNDPDFPDYVRNRIETDYNKQMGAVRDFEFTNRNTVAGALMGAGTSSGAIPTSAEDLRAANPKVAAAWDNLPKTVQQTYLRQMAENAKGDKGWTVDGLKRYQQIKGMASDDPSGFLDLPIVGESIPMSARKELINLQQTVKQKADSFPEVTKSMQLLSPMLQSAGILDDKDSRFQFRGMLSDALQDFHDKNKRAPTPEEVKQMGTLATQQISTGNIFFNRNAPLFQVPIPNELLEKAKQHYIDKRQPVPSDEELQREYGRQRYQEQYQKFYGSGSKIKPTTGVGNP